MNRASLIADLTRDEQLRRVVYDDATGKPIRPGTMCHGHPTIGIGRALDVNGITESEALLLLANDIDATEGALRREFPWYAGLDEVRQRAVVNMAFNLGISQLKSFAATIAAIAASRWEMAALGMLGSLWAKQVGARAARLAAMIRTGKEAA